MRGSSLWILAIVAGVLVVLVATAMIGDRDKSGETVPAGEWAQKRLRRGRRLARRDRGRSSMTSANRARPARLAPRSRSRRRRRGGRASSGRGSSEPCGRRTRCRRASTTPASPTRRKATRRRTRSPDWADSTRNDLEDAQDSLDEEADTLDEAITS